MEKEKNNENNQNKIQWQPLIEMTIVLFTILGTTIPLHIQSSNQIEVIRKDSYNFQEAIRLEIKDFQMAMLSETKDFHYRLCKIEEAR